MARSKWLVDPPMIFRLGKKIPAIPLFVKNYAHWAYKGEKNV